MGGRIDIYIDIGKKIPTLQVPMNTQTLLVVCVQDVTDLDTRSSVVIQLHRTCPSAENTRSVEAAFRGDRVSVVPIEQL